MLSPQVFSALIRTSLSIKVEFSFAYPKEKTNLRNYCLSKIELRDMTANLEWNESHENENKSLLGQMASSSDIENLSREIICSVCKSWHNIPFQCPIY